MTLPSAQTIKPFIDNDWSLITSIPLILGVSKQGCIKHVQSGVTSWQELISTLLHRYHCLNFYSLGCLVMCVVTSYFLPAQLCEAAAADPQHRTHSVVQKENLRIKRWHKRLTLCPLGSSVGCWYVLLENQQHSQDQDDTAGICWGKTCSAQ